MKIYLNKGQLQNVTNDRPEVLLGEDLECEKKRIQGMISHDIRFCGLVTGYRGTGKSTFVRHVLEEEKKRANVSMIVVKFNATKYDEYETFIKRFIRELYLQCKEGSYLKLERLYLHTFFNIKETTALSEIVNIENMESHATEKERIHNVSIEVSKAMEYIIPFAISYLVAKLNHVTFDNEVFKAIIWIMLILYLCVKEFCVFDINRKKTKTDSTKETCETQNEQTYNANVETLYDSEIAEYHLHNELKEISKSKNVIFVLDELDKIEEEKEWNKIFHDLKSLFLSEYCSTILIGGKNVEKYLGKKDMERDAIVSSIFSNKIYIPLNTVNDMKEFALTFFEGEDEENTSEEFYENIDVQKYFQQKIYDAKGVKRNFINGILTDLRWDEDERPYVDTSDLIIEKEFEKIFAIHEKMEEYISKEYLGAKRDELILFLYEWIAAVQKNKQDTFSTLDIIGDEKEISKEIFYAELSECKNLCDLLLNSMKEDGILEWKDGKYEWTSLSKIEVEWERQSEDEKEIIARMQELELFERNCEKIGNVICKFAWYNELMSHEELMKMCRDGMYEDQIKSGINKMLSLNKILWQKILEINDYAIKLRTHGIEADEMEVIKTFNQEIVYLKGELVEELLRYTYEKKFSLHINGKRMRRENGFDIICEIATSRKIVFTEVKYYKDYKQAVSGNLLYKLNSRMVAEAEERNVSLEECMLRIVVFTDRVAEEEEERFEKKCETILNNSNLSKDIKIYLVDLNDNVRFMKCMHKLAKSLL